MHMKKFKIYIQHDAMDCGITCLRMVCKHYGAEYGSEYLSRLCFATNEGVSLLGMSDAAERLGLHTVCGCFSLEQLRDIPLPCILHWNQNHFVVLYRISRNGKNFYIADPGKGLLTRSIKDMEEHWVSTRSDSGDKGVAMLIETTPAFYNRIKHSDDEGERRSFRFLFGYLKKYRKYFKDIFGEHSATFDIGYSARPEMFLSNLLKTPIDTYFCNINHSEAQRHAQIGGFKLKTFFDAKPTTTGHAYEMMLSALAPSCIGYDLSGDKVTPIFEKYENTYTVEFAMTTMQKAAEDFVTDMVEIFKDDIDVIYYQNYYISLPFMAYINSSKEIDKMPFSSVIFEDNVGLGEPLKMVTNWTKDLSLRNQATMDNLFNIDNDISEFLGENELVYNSTVDLKDRNKFIRLIYYTLFDKKTLQRRIGDICYKNKILWAIYKTIKYRK